MDWELVAPMVFGITIVLSVAGVLILRPISKRLGDVLESMQRQPKLKDTDLGRITELLEHMDTRIDRLEHRQDFAERMLTAMDEQRQEQRAALNDPTGK